MFPLQKAAYDRGGSYASNTFNAYVAAVGSKTCDRSKRPDADVGRRHRQPGDDHLRCVEWKRREVYRLKTTSVSSRSSTSVSSTPSSAAILAGRLVGLPRATRWIRRLPCPIRRRSRRPHPLRPLHRLRPLRPVISANDRRTRRHLRRQFAMTARIRLRSIDRVRARRMAENVAGCAPGSSRGVVLQSRLNRSCTAHDPSACRRTPISRVPSRHWWEKSRSTKSITMRADSARMPRGWRLRLQRWESSQSGARTHTDIQRQKLWRVCITRE